MYSVSPTNSLHLSIVPIIRIALPKSVHPRRMTTTSKILKKVGNATLRYLCFGGTALCWLLAVSGAAEESEEDEGDIVFGVNCVGDDDVVDAISICGAASFWGR